MCQRIWITCAHACPQKSSFGSWAVHSESTFSPAARPPGPLGEDKPLALIKVETTLEAILATIYLDRLSGLDYALCNLTDCRKIYAVTSNHARMYCSQACAHKASVRKRRALAAQAKAQPQKSAKDKRGTKR